MKRLALAVVLQLALATPAAHGGLRAALRDALWGTPIANYDPRTGNLTFTHLPGSSVLPGSDRQIDVVGPLAPENAHLPVGVAVELVEPDRISWLGGSDALAVRFDAGNVIPPGTPASSVMVEYRFEQFNYPLLSAVVEVPEPTGLAAAALGGCLLLAAGRGVRGARGGCGTPHGRRRK